MKMTIFQTKSDMKHDLICRHIKKAIYSCRHCTVLDVKQDKNITLNASLYFSISSSVRQVNISSFFFLLTTVSSSLSIFRDTVCYFGILCHVCYQVSDTNTLSSKQYQALTTCQHLKIYNRGGHICDSLNKHDIT